MYYIREIQQKIRGVLKDKIEEHGFEFESNDFSEWIPRVTRKGDDYINVSIRDNGRYDAETDTFEHNIRTSAVVCRSDPNDGTAELLRAADQIKRAAELADAINRMQIRFTETFLPQYAETVLANDGRALGELLTGEYVPGSLKHISNFVFEADAADGNRLVIEAEPLDHTAEPKQMKIKSVRLISAPSGLTEDAVQEQSGGMTMQ